MIQRGALRRQEAGGRRQEPPACPPKPPDRRSLGEGGWRRREGFAAFFSNLVETHVT